MSQKCRHNRSLCFWLFQCFSQNTSTRQSYHQKSHSRWNCSCTKTAKINRMIIENEVEVVQQLERGCTKRARSRQSWGRFFFSPPRIRFHVGEGEMLGARKDNKENIGLGWKSASSSDSAACRLFFVCARVSLQFDVWCLGTFQWARALDFANARYVSRCVLENIAICMKREKSAMDEAEEEFSEVINELLKDQTEKEAKKKLNEQSSSEIYSCTTGTLFGHLQASTRSCDRSAKKQPPMSVAWVRLFFSVSITVAVPFSQPARWNSSHAGGKKQASERLNEIRIPMRHVSLSIALVLIRVAVNGWDHQSPTVVFFIAKCLARASGSNYRKLVFIQLF